MARYVIPTVFYQANLNASSAVEVPYIKSLSWANKMNNNGNFELIIPMNSSLNPFTPRLDGYIRLSPGDTIMHVEKIERICDREGNLWYKIGGRPTQDSDDDMRAAQNEGFFSRYVYNGSNAETNRRNTKSAAVTTINSNDIIQSCTYEDNLGGYTEVEIIPVEKLESVDDTIYEEYHWGTIISGLEKPVIRRALRYHRFVTTALSWASAQPPLIKLTEPWVAYDAYYNTDELILSSGTFPRVVYGNINNTETEWDRINYNGTWVKDDVTHDVFVSVPNLPIHPGVTWHEGTFVQSRSLTLYTDNEYNNFMRNLAPNNPSGFMQRHVEKNTITTAEPQEIVTHVKGGHSGYSFVLKSKGDVQTRYKVDFNLGDTIIINDTRLNVVYTGVVSGATETIDSSGYNVDIEVGTMGATIEQRVNKVI